MVFFSLILDELKERDEKIKALTTQNEELKKEMERKRIKHEVWTTN